jgi:hypothetical protein
MKQTAGGGGDVDQEFASIDAENSFLATWNNNDGITNGVSVDDNGITYYGAAAQQVIRDIQSAVNNAGQNGSWVFSANTDVNNPSWVSLSEDGNTNNSDRWQVTWGQSIDIKSYAGIKIGTFAGSITYYFDQNLNTGATSFVTDDNGFLVYSMHTTMQPTIYSMPSYQWVENYNQDAMPHGIDPTVSMSGSQYYPGNNANATWQSATVSTYGTLFEVIGIGKFSWQPYIVYSISFTIYTGFPFATTNTNMSVSKSSSGWQSWW